MRDVNQPPFSIFLLPPPPLVPLPHPFPSSPATTSLSSPPFHSKPQIHPQAIHSSSHAPTQNKNDSKKKRTLRFLLKSACSGAAAEVLVNLALYPLDTLKVRHQFRNCKPAVTSLIKFPAATATIPARLSAWKSICHAFAGVRAGVLASAFDAFFFTLVYEGVRLAQAQARQRRSQQTSQQTSKTVRVHTALSDFCAAGVASIASSLVDAPFALARDRIRLGLQPGIRAAWKSAGSWRGVYAGLVPALARDLPAEGIEFAMFDGLKRLLFSCSPDATVNPVSRLVLGAVAGAVMGAASTPLDLAVTRIVARPKAYKGVLKAIAKVAREEGGIRATFRALPHRTCREAFSSALFFLVYDGLKGDSDDVDD